MADLNRLYEAIVNGQAKDAKAITEQALAENVPPQTIVNEYMIKAMDEVGRRFEANEFFVPELLIAARAMKGALELVKPLMAASGTRAAERSGIAFLSRNAGSSRSG